MWHVETGDIEKSTKREGSFSECYWFLLEEFVRALFLIQLIIFQEYHVLMNDIHPPSRFAIILAFAAIYLVWGSTYLGILYAIETIPPWLMVAMRFTAASLCMGVASLVKRESALTLEQKKIAIFSGALLILANGMVGVMEKWVPSGIAAVVIGAMPIWIMLIGWTAFGTGRPEVRKIVGASIGLIGIGWIAAGDTHSDTSGIFGRFAPLVLCISSWLWAVGTLIQRRALNVKSGLSFLSLQMATGAFVGVVITCLFESPWTFDWSSITTKSWLALLYLIVFGTLIGFTAYSWLSRNVEPHLVSTYALANPVIAVWLGWFLADETLSGKFVAATLLVLLGLSILIRSSKKLPVANLAD